jgi:YHS domain-containing protein
MLVMKRSNFYLLIGSFLMLGCSQPEPPKVPSKPATESKAADPKVLMKLVAADRLDGKEDKVIEKCYVCGLGMDGEAKFAETVHGYKAHLCSETCQHHFHDESDKIILETEVPTDEPVNASQK